MSYLGREKKFSYRSKRENHSSPIDVHRTLPEQTWRKNTISIRCQGFSKGVGISVKGKGEEGEAFVMDLSVKAWAVYSTGFWVNFFRVCRPR